MEQQAEGVETMAVTQDGAPGAKECPKCKESFSARGLAGHLRFAHGLNSNKAIKQARNAKPDLVGRNDEVLALIEELVKIRVQRERVKEWDKSDFFTRDEVCDEMLAALDEKEKRLRDELKKLRAPIDEDAEVDFFTYWMNWPYYLFGLGRKPGGDEPE